MLAEGWADHAKEVWLPINQLGDRVGLKFENGEITMPQEFKDAYKQGIEGGWFSTPTKPEHGGMGTPIFFQSVIWGEIATSTNMAMSVLPALTLGVYDVLNEHGDQVLVDYFSSNLAQGHWAGTMCLTEPHAGTDLGIISSKAIPQDDGSYRVTGTKIFITYGEHDMTENLSLIHI